MPTGSNEPAWLLAARADLDAGVKEVPGKKAHPRIIEMYETVGLAHSGDDTDAWCGCAAGTWLKESGYPMPPNAYGAKQFETYGMAVKPDEWQPGDIGVFYRTKLREKDWRRHVTLIIGETKTHFECLGGNQGDGVSIAKFAKKDLSAIRRPVAATAKALREAGSTEIAIADNMKKVAVTTIGTGVAGSVTAEVTRAASAPPPPPALASDIKEAVDQLEPYEKLLEAVYGIAKLVGAHPWLAAAVVGGVGIWWLACHFTRKRIERAQNGIGAVGAG